MMKAKIYLHNVDECAFTCFDSVCEMKRSVVCEQKIVADIYGNC